MEVTLTKKKLCLILTSVGILVACFLAGKASNGPRKNSLSHEFVVPSKVYLERVNETCQTDVKCQAGVMNRELFKYLSFFLRGTPYPGVFNYTNYMVAYHEMKPLEGVEPLLPGFTPVLNDVTYFQYVSEVTCTAATDDVSTVFIAINSAPGNVLRRKAIRETWLKTLNDGKLIRGSGDRVIQVAGFAFFIGNSTPKTDLTEEREQFKDILQIDMLDTYYNISIKVAGLLNWIDTRCRGVDFVLKTDDDMYVNMINLANFLHPIDKKDVRLYGKLTHGTVQRGCYYTHISYANESKHLLLNRDEMENDFRRVPMARVSELLCGTGIRDIWNSSAAFISCCANDSISSFRRSLPHGFLR